MRLLRPELIPFLVLLFSLSSPSGLAQQPVEAAEEPAAEALPLPDSAPAALEMQERLDDLLEERPREELVRLLDSWMEVARRQVRQLDRALAAPEGTPEREESVSLRADLDTLLSGADAIANAVAAAGGVVEGVQGEIARIRQQAAGELRSSTVPANRHKALELPVEVLKAQLRPLRQKEVEEQLEQWLVFLQRTCSEVRNVEVSALLTEEPEEVEAFNTRAVALRGERTALIKRVEAVITALERKGGDVEEATAYVQSVLAKPPITGWRAAWSTARAWVTDSEGGLDLARRFGIALAILVGFWFLAKGLARVARRATRSLERASELLREFIVSAVRRVTLLIGLLVALSTLGINMTPLVAAIGAAGLVIGLALQGTLGNLASGLMIMIYRPFDVSDVVSLAGVIGKVDGMTLMTTAIKTFDNQTIHVPNNKIWGDVVTNVTANQTRRVDMTFGISYDDDISKAKQILERIVTAHDKVLKDPPPMIRVHQLADSSVNLIVRPWANTADYWEVFWDLTEQVKRAFDAEGITIPFPQRDVHLIPAAANGESAAQQAERQEIATGA